MSLVGTQMRLVAVPFQVYTITGSTVAVGLVGLVEVVPLIVFSIIGGSLADTFDRRKIMFLATLGFMLNSIVLAVLTFRGEPALWSIYALTALGSAFEAVDRPPRAAIIPDLVDRGSGAGCHGSATGLVSGNAHRGPRRRRTDHRRIRWARMGPCCRRGLVRRRSSRALLDPEAAATRRRSG